MHGGSSSTTAATATPDDARWRVRFATDLVTARRVTLDDGELWLRGDALRIVLLDARGHAVDARYLRPGLQQGEDAKDHRSEAEMIRTGTMKLMKVCGAIKQPIQGA
ncbi:uncharacterized protein LOC119305543 [Triticum dicoccoides]|uniref:uncharacterized protein LOC119305543 n=1 Tax=Triticum dicoccoides TaxID=85692 RepID=UPI0018902322|nr:uncharacterized protein LOC119305543 [Triticum dicoccoides]